MTSEGGGLGLRRLGAQGPRSLGSGEMRVGEEKRADRAQDGERGQRGHLCPRMGGKERKKEVKEERNTGSWEGPKEECEEGPTSPGGGPEEG